MIQVFEPKNGRLELVRETGWFDNLITNFGLNNIGKNTALGTNCRVGTGSTAPAFTDTQLVAQIAFTTTATGPSLVLAGAPDYQSTYSVTYEFAQGSVVGNIAEIGVGSASTGANLFSRALIVDGVGSPVAIPVTAIQILRVTYRLSMYPALADATGTVSIGGVSYNYISRLCDRGLARSPVPNGIIFQGRFANFYDGDIGAVTAITPSGATAAASVSAFDAYVDGNFYLQFSASLSIAQGNFSGGIRSARIEITNGGNSAVSLKDQIRFGSVATDATIPKTSTNQLSLPFRFSWARR
ncbi:MAG: hypothetical protein ACRCV9_20115 [Burkholderiaceae bacterium]